MELIDRYVYAVTKALPLKQCEDIDKELRTLIDDMIEQYDGHEPYETKVKKVLLDLGDPDVLADNYRGSKRYLIGPKNYDKYLFILRIVTGAVFLGISVASVVGYFSSVNQNIGAALGNYFGTLFSAILQAFAWITLGFAIAERSGKTIMDDKSEEGWQLSDLPELPHKNAVISPAEPIFSIVISTVFIMVLYFAPQLFAAYIPGTPGGTTIIPIFNIVVLKGYRLLIAGIFIISVSKEVLKLIYGKWTLKLSVPIIVLSIASAILTIIVFTNPNTWNPSFAAEVMKHLNLGFDLVGFWTKITATLIIIIIAACILEVVAALFKGIKHNIV